MANLKTSWFSFGQGHVHRVNGFTFDCDVIVKITAENPRDIMFQYFGDKWGLEYSKEPEMEFFPRGIYEIGSNE